MIPFFRQFLSRQNKSTDNDVDLLQCQSLDIMEIDNLNDFSGDEITIDSNSSKKNDCKTANQDKNKENVDCNSSTKDANLQSMSLPEEPFNVCSIENIANNSFNPNSNYISTSLNDLKNDKDVDIVSGKSRKRAKKTYYDMTNLGDRHILKYLYKQLYMQVRDECISSSDTDEEVTLKQRKKKKLKHKKINNSLGSGAFTSVVAKQEAILRSIKSRDKTNLNDSVFTSTNRLEDFDSLPSTSRCHNKSLPPTNNFDSANSSATLNRLNSTSNLPKSLAQSISNFDDRRSLPSTSSYDVTRSLPSTSRSDDKRIFPSTSSSDGQKNNLRFTGSSDDKTSLPSTTCFEDRSLPSTSSLDGQYSMPSTSRSDDRSTLPSTGSLDSQYSMPSTSRFDDRRSLPSTSNLNDQYSMPSTSRFDDRRSLPSTSSLEGQYSIPSTSSLEGQYSMPSTSSLEGQYSIPSTSSLEGQYSIPSTSSLEGQYSIPSTSSLEGQYSMPSTSRFDDRSLPSTSSLDDQYNMPSTSRFDDIRSLPSTSSLDGQYSVPSTSGPVQDNEIIDHNYASITVDKMTALLQENMAYECDNFMTDNYNCIESDEEKKNSPDLKDSAAKEEKNEITSPLKLNSSLYMKWNCAICLDTYGDQEIVATNCGHVYCRSCIESYISTKAVCPTCRKKITKKKLITLYL